MASPSDLNLDAPSDLQDIPELAMQLIPPPEGTYPDKSVPQLSPRVESTSYTNLRFRAIGTLYSRQSKIMGRHMAIMWS